jgi:NAD(P)-dependent dehydrogenase (short-subunit alcohol dehydrogenase family)
MNDWRDESRDATEAPAATTGQREAGRFGDGPPVWLITGCSSGFGQAVAQAAIARGHVVVATARDVTALDALEHPDPDRLLRRRLDLVDATSIEDAVASTLDRFGRIDVLFNNAGIATLGAIEEVGDELLRRQLDVNLFGPLALTRAVLPAMRRHGDGHILQMSSMGGRLAFAGLGAYHASKWGLEGASVALAQEVAPLGIRVTLIEPGDFRTPVLAPGRMAVSESMPDYAETVGRAREGIAQLDGRQPGDPARAAEAILAVVEAPEPPLHLALGTDCYERLKQDLEDQLAELERWSHLTLSTDF